MKKMMNRLLPLILASLLLSGCGAKEPAVKKEVNLQSIYDQIGREVELPEMAQISENRRYDLLGIAPEDCTQVITAVCGDSVRTDEIWLIEAVDKAAAERVLSLAKLRLEAKKRELKDYLPDQYAIVQRSELIQRDNLIALFVSPDAGKMAELFQTA